MAGGLVGAGPEILTCTLQLFTRDLAVVRSNEVGADENWGRLAAWDPPLHVAGRWGSLAACPAPPLLHCVPWELATFAEHSFSPLTDHDAWFYFSQLHDAKAYNRMRPSRFGVSEIITAATIRKGKRASSSAFLSRHSFTTFSKNTVCTICDLHMHETHQWDAHEHHVWAVNMHHISGTDRMSRQQMHEA